MSNINSGGVEEFKPFTFSNFTEEAEAAAESRKTASAEFTPDHERPETAGQDEFVLGGFDFEFKGGYRRDEILKKTSDEIEAMIRDAHARVFDIERNAHEKGFNEGKEKGKLEGFAEATGLMNTLVDGLKQLEKARGVYYGKAEKEMVDLVLLIAAEIIRREVAQDPGIVAEVLRKAVAELEAKQSIVVRLSPHDISLISGMRESLQAEMEVVENLEFKADPAVTPGGCILETNIGSLDATVENRLMNIHRALRDQIGK